MGKWKIHQEIQTSLCNELLGLAIVSDTLDMYQSNDIYKLTVYCVRTMNPTPTLAAKDLTSSTCKMNSRLNLEGKDYQDIVVVKHYDAHERR